MSNLAAAHINAYSRSLWVLTCQSETETEMSEWLGVRSWQSTTELKDIRNALLNQDQGYVLLDMRNSPHQMLTHIRYLNEHFTACVMIALIDPEQQAWGREALSNGVDAYVSINDISGEGLYMLIDSFKDKHNQQALLLTHSDPSTGLINGPLFFDRLNHALQVAVRHLCRTGILLVSLDEYDDLVTQYGDTLSDSLLGQVANRLQKSIRNSDSLARINKGVFAVLLEDLSDEVMVAHIAQNIQQQFEKAFEVHEHFFSLSVSIGGHLCEVGGLNGDALYQQTQEALSRAISSGKQGLWFYVQEMNFKAMARLNMQQGLERALEKNEFNLHYLPHHTGKGFIPCGVIPMIYWRHPTAGIVMPEIFMDLLINSGLIIDVGIWTIEQTFQQLKAWRDTGSWNSRMQLFITISEKQLRHESLISTLIRQLSINEIKSEQIVIKINEQTAIKNTDNINKLTQQIPDIGLAIDLDSTSSGYNSFSYLKEIPVDYLCLEEGFFRHLHVDHLEASIATVIVNMAHSLGIEVMGCGANSQFKVDKMKALGCDSLQGDFFSRPVYGEDWSDYLKHH